MISGISLMIKNGEHSIFHIPKNGKDLRTSFQQKIIGEELVVFRNLLQKIECVDQEDFTWTWDHENDAFLIQAENRIIEQYINILKRDMGESLCLDLGRVSLVVDLRPWKIDSHKTSLRIGFEGKHIPDELCGHTSLEDIINLHYSACPHDSSEVEEILKNFKLVCWRIDNILGRQSEWMWERHWRAEGLAFAVVRTLTWKNKYLLVEREVDLFKHSACAGALGVSIGLSTYHRGSSFNVRLVLDGLPKNVRTNTHILEVFDIHFPTENDRCLKTIHLRTLRAAFDHGWPFITRRLAALIRTCEPFFPLNNVLI